MSLDAQDPATLAILIDRFDRFEKSYIPQMARIEQYLDKVDSNTMEIERIKKAESGQNAAIEELDKFMVETKATTKASIRNAYWGITILGLAVSAGINLLQFFFGGKK